MSDENEMKIPADRATLNAVQKENQAELRLTDAKGRQIEGTFKKAETYRKGQNEVLDLAGIEEGARLDQRNEAYASVAASLGMDLSYTSPAISTPSTDSFSIISRI